MSDKYIQKIKEVMDFGDVLKAVTTPAVKQSLNNAMTDTVMVDAVRQTASRSALGVLNYCAGDRPDIVATLKKLSFMMTKANEAGWVCLKRLCRYFCTTTAVMSFNFEEAGQPQRLWLSTDSDWGASADGKSQGGGVLQINDHILQVSGSKQMTVALSSCESEAIACSVACENALAIYYTLQEVIPEIETVMEVCIDNQGLVSALSRDQVSMKMRHVRLRMLRLRQNIVEGKIRINKISTDVNVADILTKVLPLSRVNALGALMGYNVAVLQ